MHNYFALPDSLAQSSLAYQTPIFPPSTSGVPGRPPFSLPSSSSSAASSSAPVTPYLEELEHKHKSYHELSEVLCPPSRATSPHVYERTNKLADCIAEAVRQRRMLGVTTRLLCIMRGPFMSGWPGDELVEPEEEGEEFRLPDTEQEWDEWVRTKEAMYDERERQEDEEGKIERVQKWRSSVIAESIPEPEPETSSKDKEDLSPPKFASYDSQGLFGPVNPPPNINHVRTDDIIERSQPSWELSSVPKPNPMPPPTAQDLRPRSKGPDPYGSNDPSSLPELSSQVPDPYAISQPQPLSLSSTGPGNSIPPEPESYAMTGPEFSSFLRPSQPIYTSTPNPRQRSQSQDDISIRPRFLPTSPVSPPSRLACSPLHKRPLTPDFPRFRPTTPEVEPEFSSSLPLPECVPQTTPRPLKKARTLPVTPSSPPHLIRRSSSKKTLHQSRKPGLAEESIVAELPTLTDLLTKSAKRRGKRKGTTVSASVSTRGTSESNGTPMKKPISLGDQIPTSPTMPTEAPKLKQPTNKQPLPKLSTAAGVDQDRSTLGPRSSNADFSSQFPIDDRVDDITRFLEGDAWVI